jgi:hypothetical protein
MSNALKSWSDYITYLEGKNPNSQFATFYARYKFAYNFEGLKVSDMASRTLDMYSLVTKIAFSYAALENLEKTLKLGHEARINAADLARHARQVMPHGASKLETRMYLSDALKSRLDELFRNHLSSDVRPLVEQFRHSLFHGKFTPTGWGLKGGESSIELLQGLSQVTLRKADETFTHWFKSQSKN